MLAAPIVHPEGRESWLCPKCAASLIERYRKALEDARHSLVTLNGLWATDRSIGDRRVAASESGIDSHALLDVMDEEMWRVDEEPVIARIDAALAGEDG